MSQSVGRALQILIDLGEGPRSLDDLAGKIGVHKTTVLRLLRTLEGERFVYRDSGHRYHLGARMFALAGSALEQRLKGPISITWSRTPLRRALESLSQSERLAILLDRLEFDAADGSICLGLYGDPAAKPALQKMLAIVDPAEASILRDITDAMEQLGRSVDEAPVAFDLWEEYPEKSGPHFELLNEEDRLSMLGSDSAEVRAEAVASFVNRDLDDVSRKRLFEMAKADPAQFMS